MDKITIDHLRTIMRLKLEKFLAFDLKMDYCPEISGHAVIYGAGIVGKLLLRCFDNPPVAFIDAKYGLNDVCGIPVYNIEECEDILNENTTVIVTPVWAFDEIKSSLLQYNSKVTVISLEKLVEKL